MDVSRLDADEIDSVLQDYVSAVDRDNFDVDIEFTGLLEGDTELAGGVHQGESGGGTEGIAGQLVPFAVLGFKVLELLNLGSVIGEDTLDHGAGLAAAGGGDGVFHGLTDGEGVGLGDCQGGRGLAYKGNGVLQDYVSAVDRDNFDVDIEFTGLLEGDTELAGGVHQGESGGGTEGIAGQLVPFAVLGFKVLELLNLGSVIGEDTLDHGAGLAAAGGGDGVFHGLTDGEGVGLGDCQGGRGLAYKGNGVLQDHVSAVDRDKLDGDVEGAGLLEGDTEPAGGVGEREPGGGTKGVAGEVTPGLVGRLEILELLNLGGVIGEDTLDHGAGVVAAGGGDGEFSRFTDNKGVGCRHRQGGVVKCENGDRNQTHCHGHRKDDCQQLCLFLQKKNLLTFLKPIVCHIPNRNGRHLPFLTSSF